MMMKYCLLGLAESVLTREIFNNHSAISQRAFYALSVAAILVFGWGYWRRGRLWRLGHRSAKRIGVLTAAKHLVFDVLLQRRVFGRGWASVGHVLLFGGFMGLLLATTLLSVEHWLAGLLGRAPDDPVFHKGGYFAIYEAMADAFGLALLAGCAIFAVRRWRRDDAMDHRWTDWWALGALAFLGVSGYVVEGLRIIYEQTPQPGFSFVGWGFAEAFRTVGFDEQHAAAAHFYSWWLHAFVSLVLIATIPYMRLVHSLAATIRLALTPDRLGSMAKVEAVEVEQTGVIGASDIRDFSRVQLLELDACMACGRCEDACPAFEAGKPLSPRSVVQDLRAHLDSAGPPLLGLQQLNESDSKLVEGTTAASRRFLQPTHSVAGEVVAEETLWSCTACTACVFVCPVGVNPLGLITDMRRNLIGEGKFRGSPAKTMQNMGRVGNPWGMTASDRMAWAEGLEVPTAAERPDFDVLYWVGCAAAYDPRIQKIARSMVKLLTAANVRFAVLGPEERCTGESARRIGDEFLFQELAARNVETLERHHVQREAKLIVSHCPHCVNSFKQDYPQMGGDYKVMHHTEFLAKLVREGRLVSDGRDVWSAKGGAGAGAQQVTYHDPCYLARVGEVTEAPRELLGMAVEADGEKRVVEMARNRRNTSCCGAGGGRMWFDDAPAERVGTGRVQEAIATGAETVAVACPFCLVMLSDGLAARQADVQVKDVAELLAESLEAES